MKRKVVLAVACIAILGLTACGTPKTTETKPETNSSAVEEIKPEGMNITGNENYMVGPFGSVTITIPDNWNCEELPINNPNRSTVEYGFRISPQDCTSGYVEVGYYGNFGVCGTGLEQKEVTLAGDSAVFGYFDGNSDWDHIIYRGSNEGIVALAMEAEAWSEEQKTQAVAILDTLSYNREDQKGTVGVFESDAEIEACALTTNIESVSATGASVFLTQYDENNESEITFGESYSLERKDGENWAPVEVKEQIGFHDILNTVPHASSVKHTYDWETYYGELPSGDYRIVIPIYMDGESVGPVYVHFIHRS